MKNVLIISYYFPPAGGPGVQHVTKHVKYLREFGYNPIVIAAAPSDYARLSALRMPLDESRLADVPEGTEVHCVGSRQPFRVFGMLHRLRLDYLRQLLWVPDTAVHWIRPVVQRAREIVGSKHIEFIYTSERPNSVHIAGWILKRALRRPWVVDFRDPWTQYFLARYPTRLHYWLEQRLERFLLKRADHVVTVTPTARANLLAWCAFLPPEKVTTIATGFDPSGFEQGTPRAVPTRHRPFELCYLGVFCGGPSADGAKSGPLVERVWRAIRRWLEFRPRDFDPLAHSPKFLLDAIAELFGECAELRARLRFVHIGPSSPANEQYAHRLGLKGNVEFRGYVKHTDALREMGRADALFFCLADSPSGERNDCVPQKLYEYIGSGKPILALVPPGDARDFLQRAGTALICEPRDVPAIKRALGDLLEGVFVPRPDVAFRESLHRRNATAKLAGIFNQIAVGERSGVDCTQGGRTMPGELRSADDEAV